MNLHAARPPFGRWGPPTRFATARDIAIIALCLLLIAGFVLQVLVGAPPRRIDAVTAAPTVTGAPV